MKVGKAIAAARSLRRAKKIDVLFVDYLQLLEGRGDQKHERVAHVAESLKALAMQLEIPVVAAAQLRRDADGRQPTLGDFSDSSELEKAANVALLIHRNEEGDVTSGLWVHAEKVRDGKTGSVRCVFHREYLRIREEAV